MKAFRMLRAAESGSGSRWLLALAVAIGLLAGIGGFTFLYAQGLSYMSSDPKACVNCHIMRPQYDSWEKSSHHAVATCADCHLPHQFVGKWMAKAENGFNHSKAFTFQDFHEPIMITPKNARILQSSCLHCHADVVHAQIAAGPSTRGEPECVHCHATVGHGARTGLGRSRTAAAN
jgi:cytochrome c nitrite reductase small subunit